MASPHSPESTGTIEPGSKAAQDAASERLPPRPPDPVSLSTLAPLKLPVFRLLWGTWLVANICM